MLITEAATSSCTTSQDQDRQFCPVFFSGKKIPKNGTQCVAKDYKNAFYKSSHYQCVLQNE